MINLQELFENEYVLAVLTVFIISYSGLFRYEVPNWVQKLFNNDIFRVLFIGLIAMIPAKQSPHVAIIIAIIFVLTLHFIDQKENKEKMESVEQFISISQKSY